MAILSSISGIMGVGDSKVVEGATDFNPDILNLVPTEIRTQLEKYAESRERFIRELTESYEKLKVDSGNGGT